MTITHQPPSLAPAVPASRSLPAAILVWSLQIALGLLYLMAGIGKLSGMPEMVALFRAIGAGQWLRYAIGVIETAGGLALFVPSLSGLAALALCPVMLGAIIVSVIVPHESLLPPIISLAGLVVVMWMRRADTARVIGRFR